MCGIFGYVGNKQAPAILSEGLQALEYRGYDSAGMYVAGFGSVKAEGKVFNLKEKAKNVSGVAGIAHTRWATHGAPLERNAHPHSGNNKRVWLVHNGIIENYAELKEPLVKMGHVFESDTDSEVLAHLIEVEIEKGKTLLEALRNVLPQARGSYALAIMDREKEGEIIIVRKGSPLVVGVAEDESFISSDVTPLLSHTREVIYLLDDEMGIIKKDKLLFFDKEGKVIAKEAQHIDWSPEAAKKNGYKHFMLKEILEQPEVLKRSLAAPIDVRHLAGRKIARIYMTGCGTAYYSAMAGSSFLEKSAGIPVITEYASEFRYRLETVGEDALVIAMSQSGETADTLEVLREAKARGATTIAIVNAVGSTMSREVDHCFYTHAGPEIGVASTKAFTSQLLMLYRFAYAFAGTVEKELSLIPQLAEQVLKQGERLRELALKYVQYEDFLFLGRSHQYPIALESALKLKEISYVHAEGYASGEMKHGTLALIDESFPCIVFALKDGLYEKNISAIEEIRARKGKVIAVATEGDDNIRKLADDVIYIPPASASIASLISVIPLQLFAYHFADHLGLPIDQPRNLAKSVTVE